MDVTKPGTMVEAAAPAEAVREEPAEVTSLVERAKAGEAEAFGDLMRLYEPRVIAIGMQMGLSRDDAMDVCQDAFIKVFRYIGRFRSGESFFKWLYRIAVHVVYDHLRHARPVGFVSIEDLDSGRNSTLRDSGPSLATRVETDDLAGKLVKQLPCLTRQERIVFVLRDLHEMPTGQIGAILGISQITIRRHCAAARRKLRDRLFPRNV